jgi:hypothetical protein
MRLTDELRGLKDRVFHHLGPRHAEVLEGIAVAAEHKGPEPEEEEVKTSGSAGETPAEEALSTEPGPVEERTTPGVTSTPETFSSPKIEKKF